MDLMPILHTLRRHKTAVFLIVFEIALTTAIVCNALHLITLRIGNLQLEPEVANPRLQRFYLLSRSGRREEAEVDAGWLLENRPPGTDEAELRRLLR